MTHRFYADGLTDGLAVLSPEDANHALRVLRMVPGDPAELILNGQRFRAVLREGARLELLEPLPSTEAALRITLFQGLPKADKMDWIVQKAVEIGVARIVPVVMSRCVVKLTPADAEKKVLRWNRIAREAGKQSGRCVLPEVSSPVPLSRIPEMAAPLEARAVPWEETSAMGPAAFLAARPNLRSLGLVIGPEGGIDPAEIETLSGFQPLTLGPRILRTETAGLAASAAMLALAGEMEGTL